MSVSGISQNAAISPKGLISGAVGFFEAARMLEISGRKSIIHWPALYVNLCYTIELSLKAYLLYKGRPEKYLRNEVGHDIIKALKYATDEGYICPNNGFAEIATLLAPVHLNHSLRYLEGKSVELPDDHEAAIQIVHEHLKQVGIQMQINEL